jgi:hypothetical protein
MKNLHKEIREYAAEKAIWQTYSLPWRQTLKVRSIVKEPVTSTISRIIAITKSKIIIRSTGEVRS